MGRKKQFSDSNALSAASMIFWKKGYTNTTLKDLLEGMEIKNGTFYNSYVDKKNLFIEAMKNYEQNFSEQRMLLFKRSASFKVNIRAFFRHIFDRQEEAICPKGCFLFNSVSYDISDDIEIFKIIRQGIAHFEDFLDCEIKKSVLSGELAAMLDSKLTAAILVTHVQGAMKLSAFDYDNLHFRAQTDALLKALGI